MSEQYSSVSEAFSRQAPVFDALEEGNAILQEMRRRVRSHVLEFAAPGMHMLELNAGTGLDAEYFSGCGLRVHATDVAAGMTERLRQRASILPQEKRFTVDQCSYTNLDNLDAPVKKFDCVFSNFGGLNCIPDLRVVARQLPELLNPGAFVTVVLMPPVCPWELLLSLKGNVRTAFRRLRTGGAEAHIEGIRFTSYYFTPREAAVSFGPEFRVVKLEGLASLMPPPYLEQFPRRFPGLYRLLARADQRVKNVFPFNRCCDHFILTLRFLPEQRQQ